MIVVGVVGASGKTGSAICDILKLDPKKYKILEFSSKNQPKELELICQNSDVIIDFSSPEMLDSILKYSVKHNSKLIIGTTGFNESQMLKLQEAGKIIPIVYSANMSVGINLLTILSSQAVEIVDKNYDIEIIEYHHRYKKDAPSGTALMLAKVLGIEKESRTKIASVRAGGIYGEHHVLFANQDEVITINHQALNRNCYATGAIKAAKWLLAKPPGFYSMMDVLNYITAKNRLF